MSILIAIAAWNRKNITELSLYVTNKYKGRGNKVVVYNDHSTEYDNDFLGRYCDQVVRLPEKLGIDYLRLHQFAAFLGSDHEYLYLTDNDVIHDPCYVAKLLELYAKYTLPNGAKLPVCLFNSIYSAAPANTLLEFEDAVMRKTAPGVSLFFNREMIEKVVQSYHDFVEQGESLAQKGNWDIILWSFLKRPCITTTTSFIEHFGESGLHNPAGRAGMDKDRALNPTGHLKQVRNAVIDYVLFEGQDPKPLL